MWIYDETDFSLSIQYSVIMAKPTFGNALCVMDVRGRPYSTIWMAPNGKS